MSLLAPAAQSFRWKSSVNFKSSTTGFRRNPAWLQAGQSNVVTKSGANVIHGDAFLFFQNGAFNVRDPLEEPALGKADFNRYRAGFSIGGPIRRDHTFYYTAFEQEHTRAQAASDIAPAAIVEINSVLASGVIAPSKNYRLTTGFFPVSRAETEVSGKLSHQITDRQSLMLRYSFTNNREAGDAFNTNALSDFTVRGSSFTKDHALVGSLASVLTNTMVNDARFQVATRQVTLRSTDQTGPGFEIAGIAIFGRP